MIYKAFHDFDDDGSGAISMQELKALRLYPTFSH